MQYILTTMDLCRIYGGYLKGKIGRKFRLLTWTSLMGQIVNPVNRKGKGVNWVDRGYSYFSQLRVSL